MHNILSALKYSILASLLTIIAACNPSLEVVPLSNPIFTEEEVSRLNGFEFDNEADIIETILLNGDDTTPENFSIANPFVPATSLTAEQCNDSLNCRYRKDVLNKNDDAFPARESVYDWWETRETLPETAEVCGIKFIDDSNYRLDTFENIDDLRAAADYSLTHYQACGTCSSLQDLAVYGTKDLTEMAKFCTKKSRLGDVKACMQEIGFSNACAEVWAYNGDNTKQICPIECVKAYGLFRLILGKENADPVTEDGELNQCLQCDELMSGPGFQYGSGRTRRNTGINSEIQRPEEQIYSVSHDYF